MVKVKWQSTAKRDLREICDYYRHTKQAPRTANNIKNELFTAARKLEAFPELGAKELLLPQDTICFRYLVVRKHYKLIYFQEMDTCHIVAIWDCRNNPDILQNKLE